MLLAICGHPVPHVVHRQPTTGAGLDWLFAAAIGAGGSVLGGLAGGWFALHAAKAQWQRDREASQTDRSHQAALALAGEIASLQGAVEAWIAHPEDVAALVAAFNAFSLSAAVQSIALIDDELRSRINYHTLLAREFSASAASNAAASPQSGLAGEAQTRAEIVRRHTEAVLEAIDAHISGRPLPPYEPPVDVAAGS